MIWHRLRYGHWPRWVVVTLGGDRNEGVWTLERCEVCGDYRTVDHGGDGCY